MTTINPYLTFPGTCEDAFSFYQTVFGGEFSFKGRFSEMPPEFKVSDEEKDKIMHVSLPISKETVLMGSDSSESMGAPALNSGNNFAVSINTDTEDEARRIFNELSTDGTVTMPLEKTFWGSLFGMFTDKFGIHWMVNYGYNQNESN